MTVQELLTEGYNTLKKENIESYLIDSQLILGKVLNLDKLSIMLNRKLEVNEEKSEEYFKLIELRRKKMPVKYLLNECEFMGKNFYIKEGVLIPRPDTEILVEEMIKRMEKCKEKNIMLCDVCCGSGIIGISIADVYKNVTAHCYDISKEAEEVTKVNIKKFDLENRVDFHNSDLLKHAIENQMQFDYIVSNPPYIRKDIIPTLMEDVKDYEPYIALCGGEDGLDFYRKIASQSRKVLKTGGTLAFEIGYDQKDNVEGILYQNGFRDIDTLKDLAGNNRVVIGVAYS